MLTETLCVYKTGTEITVLLIAHPGMILRDTLHAMIVRGRNFAWKAGQGYIAKKVSKTWWG
jgi:hypothetical protein